jgi:2-desacetyl-2-hydroxyethyl bacteriochlorophyllide A dehydrogenase
LKAIILEQPGVFQSVQIDDSFALADGEAWVKVQRIGICGTDLHAYRGKQPFFSYPRILGHELGVEVVDVAPNAYGITAGDRCSVEPYLNCGHCIACRRQKPNCCVNMQVLGVHTDGGMREYLKVPVRKLHKSSHLTLEQLALVETLGIGSHAVQRAQITAEDTVLVIGAGPIGLAVMQFVQLTGATLVVLDKDLGRLQFCRDHLQVQHTLQADDDSVMQVQALLNGDLPTVVMDATGNAASMMNAFAYVAHGGKLIYVGLFQGEVTFNDPLFHRKEMTLLASRNATPGDFKDIIVKMEQGQIDTRPWITHRLPFDAMISEFPHLLDGNNGVIKAMVEV